jgi:hypothetical protein
MLSIVSDYSLASSSVNRYMGLDFRERARARELERIDWYLITAFAVLVPHAGSLLPGMKPISNLFPSHRDD